MVAKPQMMHEGKLYYSMLASKSEAANDA